MDPFKGEKVIIRTKYAGVHFGELAEKDKDEVILKNSKRIWKWSGALTLNEIAMKGVDMRNSKISEPVDKIWIGEVIEIIPISKNSNILN